MRLRSVAAHVATQHAAAKGVHEVDRPFVSKLSQRQLILILEPFWIEMPSFRFQICSASSSILRHAGVGTPLRNRPDEILQRFDFVVASVHNRFKLASSALSARAHVAQVRVRFLVGPQTETANLAERWLAAWPGLVAVCVGSPIGDIVRITLKNIGLSELLAEVRSLVDHGGTVSRERVAHVQLRPAPQTGGQHTVESPGRTALDAAMNWIHVVLRGAVAKLARGNDDLPGLAVSAETVADLLDDKSARTASHVFDGIQAADAELSRAMAAAHAQDEPIVRAARVFGLSACRSDRPDFRDRRRGPPARP